MNAGPGNPSGGGGGRSKRRRGRRPPNRGGAPNGRDRQQHSGIYSAPMDHSYRATLGGNNGSRPGRMRPGFAPASPPTVKEALAQGDNGLSHNVTFVGDLFFQAKIQETALKLNLKVFLRL